MPQLLLATDRAATLRYIRYTHTHPMHTRTTSVLVLVMQLRLILEHFYLHASLPHAPNLLPRHDSHNCIMRCLLFLSGRHLRNLFASDSRAPRHDSCAAKYFNYTNRRCTQARGRVRGGKCVAARLLLLLGGVTHS